MNRQDVIKFGQLALQKGMITQEQLREAIIAFQNKDNLDEFIQIFIEKGFLTSTQVSILLEKVKKANQIGHYKIIRQLGSGGMGVVYLAEDLQQGILVALKVLNPELSRNKEMLSRFFREAAAFRMLEHRNIVKSYGEGRDENQGVFYIAMEYVEGQSLADLIEQKGQLSPDLALDILRQVVIALQVAYEKGIIHRDIKPENILITKDGTAKLTDFGLVKIKDQKHISLTQTGMFMGTPHYISPEQAQGVKNLDIRSDFYSLGITLFHMITGVLPFDSDSALVICQKHLMEPLPDPADYNKMVSPALTELIRKLTAKTPEERPQTPKELLEMIEKVRMGSLH
ncbi:MAG: serine/threonine protein kinase, partial [Planctomycetota bacterium]